MAKNELARVAGLGGGGVARLGGTTAARAGAKKPKAAKVTRAPRVLVEECPRDHTGAKGLCGVCGWEGKRVPAAWIDEPPGTAMPDEPSTLLGRIVYLRGEVEPSKVVAVGTPLGPSLLQTGRRSQRYTCQPSLILRTRLGSGFIETPVLRSKATERMRVREGLCGDAQTFSSVDKKAGYARYLDRESAKKGVHPFDMVGELPYPHRRGSSACCINSPVYVDRLSALVADYQETGEEADFAKARDAIRKGLPRDLRATMTLEETRDLSKGVERIKDHCWRQWLEAEERGRETRKDFRTRVREAKDERKRLGLKNVTSGFQRQRSAQDVSEIRALRAKAAKSPAEHLAELAEAFAALPVEFEPVE